MPSENPQTTLPPVPREPIVSSGGQTSAQWTRWLQQVQRVLSFAGGIAWGIVNKAGSRLTDITIRTHAMLQDVLGWVNDADDAQVRHISNADGKVWQDHVDETDGNPHGTDHAMLDEIAELDPTSTDATKDRHLSDAQAKVWQDHTEATDNPHTTTLDQATAAGANSSILFSCGGKVAFTPEGGLAVKLTNRTGAASVKGSVLTMSTAYDAAFALQTAEFDGVAVAYESGIADGAESWVVVSGIAEVLLKDGTAATHGAWTKCADTDGRAEATIPPSGIGALSTADHFKEIGHCIESKAAGTDVLAKVVLHWN